MKLILGDENKKSQDQSSSLNKEEYQSWDPLTQSKFVYDIHEQLGNPISRIEAYETAHLGVTEDAPKK